MCVYKLYFDRCEIGTLSCLTAMQVIPGDHGELVQIKCVGDFNDQMAHFNTAKRERYKTKGFNVSSRLMNGFVADKNLIIVYHEFKQNTQHTYFNVSSTCTWVDQVLGTQ